MKMTLRILLLIGSLLLTSAAMAEDSVDLRSGEVFHGKVLRVNQEEVSIKLGSGGILSFKVQQVYRVRRWLKNQENPEVLFFYEEKAKPAATGNSESHSDSSLPQTAEGEAQPNNGENNSLSRKTESIFVAQEMSHWNWSLSPPQGFEVMTARGSPDLVQAWKDPKTQSSIDFSVLRTGKLPEKAKEALVKEFSESGTIQIFRDKALQRGGDGGYKGWLLEVERTAGGKPVRELSVFVQGHDAVVLLTFLAPASEFPVLVHSFEESLQTFRLFPAAPSEKTKDPPPAAAPPESTPLESAPAESAPEKGL